MASLLNLVFGTYISIIGLIGLTFNLLILSVSLLRRKLLEPFEWFLPLLACSDLLQSSILTLPAVSAFAGRWVFTNLGCEMYGFLAFLAAALNFSTLSVMAIIRWIKTTQPHKGCLFTRSWVRKSMLFILGYSVFWTVGPMFGWGRYVLEPSGLTCSIDWRSDTKTSRSYITLVFIFELLVPFSIILISGYKIIQINDARAKKQRLLGIESDTNRRRSRRVSKITIVMCLGFLLTWLPYAALCLHVTFLAGDAGPDVLVTTFPSLWAKLSVLVNPVVYAFLNPRFRRFVCSVLGVRAAGGKRGEGDVTYPVRERGEGRCTQGQGRREGRHSPQERSSLMTSEIFT